MEVRAVKGFLCCLDLQNKMSPSVFTQAGYLQESIKHDRIELNTYLIFIQWSNCYFTFKLGWISLRVLFVCVSTVTLSIGQHHNLLFQWKEGRCPVDHASTVHSTGLQLFELSELIWQNESCTSLTAEIIYFDGLLITFQLPPLFQSSHICKVLLLFLLKI